MQWELVQKVLYPSEYVSDSKHIVSVNQYTIFRSGAFCLNLIRKSVSSDYMKDSDSCSLQIMYSDTISEDHDEILYFRPGKKVI